MTKNRVLDELRAIERRPRAVVALDDVPPLEVLDAPFERLEAIDAVWRAVEELNVDLKMALLLRDVVGLSYTEIADSLEITLATVKWRIYKAREEVQLALAREGITFGDARASSRPSRRSSSPRSLAASSARSRALRRPSSARARRAGDRLGERRSPSRAAPPGARAGTRLVDARSPPGARRPRLARRRRRGLEPAATASLALRGGEPAAGVGRLGSSPPQPAARSAAAARARRYAAAFASSFAASCRLAAITSLRCRFWIGSCTLTSSRTPGCLACLFSSCSTDQ